MQVMTMSETENVRGGNPIFLVGYGLILGFVALLGLGSAGKLS